MNKKTRKEFIEELKALQNQNDIESNHCDADNILCGILTQLGYADIVDEYNQVPKWYA